MLKIIIAVLVIVALGTTGLFLYNNTKIKDQVGSAPGSMTPASSMQPSTTPEASLSPVFSYLSAWVPDAVWDVPQKSTEDTPYGQMMGMRVEGKMTGGKSSIERNFENEDVMSSLGFAEEDIKFAADGPGASNWGYTKTENGRPQVVIFSYSTNRLLGPEDKSAPFTNLSVFVSDQPAPK